MARIGVDVGGTNTDLVLECRRGVFFHKVPSTPADQSIGVIEGVKQICRIAEISDDEIQLIAHGTTVATNITIENNGAEMGFLTTRGFRDILHIGRHKRPLNFSLHFEVPWQARPLVRRRNRIAVTERILPPDGRIEVGLDEDEVRAACALFRKRNIRSVAIGFMFSFLNAAHERRAKEIVIEEIPDAYVSLSSEVANVVREYERFSTTAMNGYVGPKTSGYLRNLEAKVREAGFPAKVRVIQSNGGISTVEGCSRRPISVLMSGPAGGVIGGIAEAELAGTPNILTIDIGGTSADISTIPNGRFRIMNPRDTFVGGHAVMTPMIDLITIGAGGGSIAYVDEAGGFNVGPRSAGAVPGPACYDRGGTEPTVTDAQVVLGRMDADRFLGGDLPLKPELSHKAIKQKIADPLGISVTEAALGIIRVVNSNMALAIRSNSIARGLDPRDFSLMPFGGAGPFHGVALAEAVSAKDVLVPVAPGITAAMGLLSTDIQYEHVRSVITPLATLTDAGARRVNAVIESLMAEARRDLDGDGIEEDRHQYEVVAECRYHGQGFELRAALPEGRLSVDNCKRLIDDFHEQHRRDYGYTFDDSLVELYNVRVIARALVPHIALPELAAGDQSQLADAQLYSRETIFDDGVAHPTPRYDRSKLGHGVTLSGPAILLQHNSTTLLPPGYMAEVLLHGGLRINRH
ncbi:unnamed protein product [Ciceribacter sp. T2.26MG-112.2]|uniref:hydantoinase/oxoprolinase family protein n=1 Tax=Ciceribacter sp. T2.26MG-112.2 TaxID=3137154 RepID=UPI000E1B270E|nr:hydantoinase/oxoprolinase family protein [Ciceribacter naphthalenivorans]SSC72190.1 unnamed protein product [Ciceribacter naphthalenivorans]SSX47458.1 unnamed protein product [Ciceribacter naphthalenivorans]